MIFQILGSSSSGNCALLETPKTRILIDAGLSGRQIVQLLEQAGKPIETVEAVFLTHEHGDHIAGLRGLARFRHLKFFANYGTAQAASVKLTKPLPWMLFETGTAFQFADLRVETVLLPHDAMEPVGYVFRTGGDDLFSPQQSLAWFTDLGYAPPALRVLLRDVQVLVMEANHCLEMLEADEKRPWSVKQRIRGRHGHLSNEAVCEFLQSVEKPLWRRVLLGHLSRDCNCPVRLRSLLSPLPAEWKVECLAPDRLLFDPVELASL